MLQSQAHHERDQKQLLSHSTHGLPAAPDVLFKLASGFHHTLALKTAVDLDLCTAIAEGNTTAAQLSERCRAAYHGIESLCNYLVAHHLLRKQGNNFELTDEARIYLDRRSEHFLGGLVEYMALPEHISSWLQLTSAVRHGGSLQARPRAEPGTAVAQARATAGLRRPFAVRVAALVGSQMPPGEPFRVLNAGAGHGMFGVMLAAQVPDADVWLTDLGPVLGVARENARQEKMLDRVSFLPGDIHSISPEAPFAVVMATYMLSPFDTTEMLRVLQRLFALLSPGGLIVVADDVVDESRTSPLPSVSQNLNLLVSTTGGKVYSVSELNALLHKTGFEGVTAQGLGGGVVFLAHKPDGMSSTADASTADPAMHG